MDNSPVSLLEVVVASATYSARMCNGYHDYQLLGVSVGDFDRSLFRATKMDGEWSIDLFFIKVK